MENWQRGGFGLYVHWPFCAAKCPYCDFNSHVVAMVDQTRWRDALLRDLAYWAERTPDRVLGSIFFGGGTPSMMPPETVAAIVEAARGHWRPANDLEVTLEANPTSVEVSRFAGFVDGGVNRFSIGMQALADADLKRLGRLHDVAQGRRALDVALSLTDRVSFDLIYARQGQPLAAWKDELHQALDMAGEHLSLYQLTIEDGTAFGTRRAAGRLPGLPDEDLAADMFEMTQEACAAAGLVRYEVSNHARPGAECRHNLIYWRGGDWIGIGPGAHGRIGQPDGRVATTALSLPGAWITANERNGTGMAERSVQSGSDTADEYALMALRMRDGIDLGYFEGVGGQMNDEAVQRLCDDGLVSREAYSVRSTDSGVLLLNEILRQILSVDA